MTSAIEAKVVAIATLGLVLRTDVGKTAQQESVITIAPDESHECIEIIAANHLLGAAIQGLIEERLDLVPDAAAELVSLHDDAMAVAMTSEATAIRVSDLFTNAGMAHRIIDGPAVAHASYEDPALRTFEGVSVLVMASDIDAAITLLEREGASRLTPEIRSGFDRRFAPSIEVELDGVAVHIVRTLCPGQFGVSMKPNDLFVLRRVIRIAGVDIPVLDPTDRLLAACYRLALEKPEPELARVRDVMLLAGTDGNLGFDAARFEDSVDRWQGRAVIRRAVRLVEELVGNALPEALAWYSNVWIDDGDRAALSAYVVDDAEERETALEVTTFKALAMADRPAFTLAVGLADGVEPVDRLKGLLGRRRS